MKYVSIPDQLFNSGIPETVLLKRNFVSPVSLDEKNTIYGGFRFVPNFIDSRHLSNAGVMILVRDPRDLLTSLYYSVARSHGLPDGEAGRLMKQHRDWASQIEVDTFVLDQVRHDNWVERFARISSLKDRGKSWRYEDVILDKARWYDDILEYLELDLPRDQRQELVKREDIVPGRDRPDEHIRQVKPGDHQRKLKPETIEELNSMFKESMSMWGYSK